MKRILLSLAAVAALASCVKENNLEPAAGQLTISAVSADSKTLLSGYDVVWEKTDKIAVVVSDGTTAEFSAVESTVNGSEADFVGTVSTDLTDATSAYAVYPAAAAGKTHTLPAEQTGDVSGLMLSTAVLDVEDLQKGASKAEFYNALTLLQVVVPEGVQEVKFSADMYSSLVGKVDFSVDAATGAVTFTKTNATRYLTLKAAEGLEAKSYSLLVYPGKVNELTLHMVGLDGAEYTSTVADLEFVAGEYRTINLCNIFNIYSEDTLHATPVGGNVLVPVVSTVDHEFTVTTDASWITYVETKGFHGTEIVLNVEANTTDAAREASVTIKWGEDAKDSRTYKVSQEALYDHFLNDANGNPIKWEESFGLYSSESDAKNETNAKVTYKNVFTIELSDDFSKGTYKVNGMFVENNAFTGKTGGTYYANYKEGQFIVLKGEKGYSFSEKEIALTYSETDMTFTASAPIAFGSKYDNKDMPNKSGFIGGYKVAVKVEEPEVGGDLTVAGEWNQTGSVGDAAAYATVTISLDGDQVTLTNFLYEGVEVTGTLSGNTITLPAYTTISESTGPIMEDLVLTVSADLSTITAPDFNIGGWIDVTGYGATRELPSAPGEDEELTVAGEWNQAGSVGDAAAYATVTISLDGDQVTLTNFLYEGVEVTGTLSGNTITLPAYTTISELTGPIMEDLVLTVSADLSTITAPDFNIGGWIDVTGYSASRKETGGATPEPADPWATAASFTNDGIGYGAFMRELKVYADDTNMYVRLTVEKLTAYCTEEWGPLGNYLDIVLADGEGDTKLWWGWTTPATKSYKLEHKGDITDGELKKMRWYHDPVNEADRVYVDYTTEEVDGNYVYNFTYPREWIDQYASSTGKLYVSFMLWNEYKEYWVIPQTGNSMLEVTLP